MTDDRNERLDELESLVATQRERIARLEDQVDASQRETRPALTRREALTGAGLLGAAALGAGPASADAKRGVGTPRDPVEGVHATDITADRVETAGPVVTADLSVAGSPYADVTAYGAAGDGTTDDTAAIRSARDDVAPGDVVFFPSGTYLVSEAVDRAGRAFVGASRYNASLKAASGGDWDTGGANIATAVCYDRGADRSVCTDLGVDINGEDAAGIACFGGRTLHLTGNYVRNGTDSGIQFWGNDVSGAPDCRDGVIADNVVENAKWNLVLDGACVDCSVRDNVSRNPTRRHVSVDASQSDDDRPATGCVVRGNLCTGVTGDPGIGPGAIQVRRGVGVGISIAANVVRNWPSEGIKVEDAWDVRDNVLVGGSERLIRAILLDGTRDGLVLAGNRLVDANVGIQAKSNVGTTHIHGNVARNLKDPERVANAYTDEWVVRDNYEYGTGASAESRLMRVHAEGSATVSSGSTSTTWTYPTALYQAPDETEVRVTPTSSMGQASHYWVSDLRAGRLTIELDRTPTRSVTFAVTVDIAGGI